jgi:hypothetical protein
LFSPFNNLDHHQAVLKVACVTTGIIVKRICYLTTVAEKKKLPFVAARRLDRGTLSGRGFPNDVKYDISELPGAF